MDNGGNRRTGTQDYAHVKSVHGQQATVRLDDMHSSSIELSKGKRQGCLLNVYDEYVIRKSLEGWKGGAWIGGEIISNLRFADDTMLCVETEEEMKELLDRE